MSKYNVKGMSCAACSARVEKAVMSVDGVKSCEVNLLTASMNVDGGLEADIISAVRQAGYDASLLDDKKDLGDLKSTLEKRKILIRLSVSVALLAVLMYLSMALPHYTPIGLYSHLSKKERT